MKFSTIFSTLLAAASVAVNASPIARNEVDSSLISARETTASLSTPFPTELVKRGDDGDVKIEDSDTFAALAQAYGGELEDDKYYVLTAKWPLRDEIDNETPAELQELQKKLGFYHIGFIVGKVSIKESGNKKHRKLKRDFDGQVYDTIKKENKDIKFRKTNWDTSKRRDIEYVKMTTKKKADAINNKAKDYEKDHPVYSVEDNNCNTFVQALLSEL
ncbi:hypothetical protein TESG_04146 [Trichophyton tonsurans CBS 112818]|uniref:PPPDE domain-containing protein n=2 Tax=Trichophyton TaxID=5550 RepID=F2PVZ1_TRIEC|nr:hypothetical protein TESG_04146 [Trichophyton tonsurans CBS 112818]EGE06059.1 hypothetical protein TEQG_05173 [Trichophyton equinum CBS 127.97]